MAFGMRKGAFSLTSDSALYRRNKAKAEELESSDRPLNDIQLLGRTFFLLDRPHVPSAIEIAQLLRIKRLYSQRFPYNANTAIQDFNHDDRYHPLFELGLEQGNGGQEVQTLKEENPDRSMRMEMPIVKLRDPDEFNNRYFGINLERLSEAHFTHVALKVGEIVELLRSYLLDRFDNKTYHGHVCSDDTITLFIISIVRLLTYYCNHITPSDVTSARAETAEASAAVTGEATTVGADTTPPSTAPESGPPVAGTPVRLAERYATPTDISAYILDVCNSRIFRFSKVQDRKPGMLSLTWVVSDTEHNRKHFYETLEGKVRDKLLELQHAYYNDLLDLGMRDLVDNCRNISNTLDVRLNRLQDPLCFCGNELQCDGSRAAFFKFLTDHEINSTEAVGHISRLSNPTREQRVIQRRLAGTRNYLDTMFVFEAPYYQIANDAFGSAERAIAYYDSPEAEAFLVGYIKEHRDQASSKLQAYYNDNEINDFAKNYAKFMKLLSMLKGENRLLSNVGSILPKVGELGIVNIVERINAVLKGCIATAAEILIVVNEIKVITSASSDLRSAENDKFYQQILQKFHSEVTTVETELTRLHESLVALGSYVNIEFNPERLKDTRKRVIEDSASLYNLTMPRALRAMKDHLSLNDSVKSCISDELECASAELAVSPLLYMYRGVLERDVNTLCLRLFPSQVQSEEFAGNIQRHDTACIEQQLQLMQLLGPCRAVVDRIQYVTSRGDEVSANLREDIEQLPNITVDELTTLMNALNNGALNERDASSRRWQQFFQSKHDLEKSVTVAKESLPVGKYDFRNVSYELNQYMTELLGPLKSDAMVIAGFLSEQNATPNASIKDVMSGKIDANNTPPDRTAHTPEEIDELRRQAIQCILDVYDLVDRNTESVEGGQSRVTVSQRLQSMLELFEAFKINTNTSFSASLHAAENTAINVLIGDLKRVSLAKSRLASFRPGTDANQACTKIDDDLQLIPSI